MVTTVMAILDATGASLLNVLCVFWITLVMSLSLEDYCHMCDIELLNVFLILPTVLTAHSNEFLAGLVRMQCFGERRISTLKSGI